MNRFKYLLILLGVLTLTTLVYAATAHYQVNSGATVTINEQSVCKKVKNNNAESIFVPTNTAGEWQAFRSNAQNVVLSDCCSVNMGNVCALTSCTTGTTQCDDSCGGTSVNSINGTACPGGTCQGGVCVSCSSGYTYVVIRSRCEMAPTCSSGTYNAVTDKCESVYAATSAYSSCGFGFSANPTPVPPPTPTSVAKNTIKYFWFATALRQYFHGVYYDSNCVITLSGTCSKPSNPAGQSCVPSVTTPRNVTPGSSFAIGLNQTVFNMSTSVYTCVAGDTLSGSSCTRSIVPTCSSGGILDTVNNVCRYP